jgi:ABC-type transporter Mla MlaB component
MNSLTWDIETTTAGVSVLVSGAIDEDARLDRLAAQLVGAAQVRLDLSQVRRINSCGVREWVRFMRSIPVTTKIVLAECSPTIVAQVNMISNFIGHAKIESVKAPFTCLGCGYEEDLSVSAKSPPPHFPERICPRCSKPLLIFDDVETSYFAFMAA